MRWLAPCTWVYRFTTFDRVHMSRMLCVQRRTEQGGEGGGGNHSKVMGEADWGLGPTGVPGTESPASEVPLLTRWPAGVEPKPSGRGLFWADKIGEAYPEDGDGELVESRAMRRVSVC